MYQEHDVAHYLGSFLKWVGILAVFAVTATLSFGFFKSISPAGMPWFPVAGLSLTEGGLALWLAALRLQKHHAFKSAVSVIMAWVSAITTTLIAVYEFYALIASAYTLVEFPWIFQIIAFVIPLLLGVHVIVFVIEIMQGNFSQPGRAFRQRGNLIPRQGNLIPSHQAEYTIEELQQMQSAITGYLVAARGGTNDADPLAGRVQENRATVNLAPIGQAISGAASSVMRKLPKSTRRGERAGRVPGKTKTTIDESGLSSMNEPKMSDEDEYHYPDLEQRGN